MIRMFIIAILCVNVAQVAFASAAAAAVAAEGKMTKEARDAANLQAQDAFKKENRKKLRWALKNGADSLQIFFHALWNFREDEDFELALICTEHGLDLTNINIRDSTNFSLFLFPLFYHSIRDTNKKQQYSKQYDEIMALLLTHPKVDLDWLDNNGETLLNQTVHHQNWKLFHQLLFLGVNSDTVRDCVLEELSNRDDIKKKLKQATKKDFSFIPEEEIVACESLATRRRMMNKGNFKVKNMFTDRMHKQAGIKMVKYAAASFELPGRLHQALQQENRGQFSDEDELPSAKKAKVEAQKNEKTKQEVQQSISLAAALVTSAQQRTNSSSNSSSSSSSSSSHEG